MQLLDMEGKLKILTQGSQLTHEGQRVGQLGGAALPVKGAVSGE
jgi:hypothetical protein